MIFNGGDVTLMYLPTLVVAVAQLLCSNDMKEECFQICFLKCKVHYRQL